jgi:phage tail sheath gpL-like
MFISKPNVTLNIIPASQLASVQAQKALIVCQMLPAGTAVSEALIQDHPNDSSEDTLLGRTSMGASMVREFKKLNKLTRLDILPIDDASGTQGTAVAAITGPATEDGTITVTVGSEINHSYDIDVTDADSATVIGDAIAAAVTADLDAPFSAANVTGTVTFTADQDGTLCNTWDIKVSGTVAGVAIALTGWTGGATDPTITTLLDAIANIRYQTIIWPSSFTITTLETDLDAKFNVTNDVMDGIGIQTILGTLSGAKSAVASLNSQSLCVVWNKTVSKTTHEGAATPEFPDVISAQVGAIRALRLTESAPLTQFLTSVAPVDQFGGVHIASLPYFNTLLPNLPVANAVDFPSQEDQDEAESNGLSIIGPNRAFNGTIFGGMVTTYLTDAGANPDLSYKFLNSVDTASANREFFVNNYRDKYAQTRLTDGDLIARKDMANEASIRAFSGEIYDQLARDALTQAGRAAKKDFMDNLVVSLNLTTGTATVTAAPLMVSQLRVFLGTIQVNFGG